MNILQTMTKLREQYRDQTRDPDRGRTWTADLILADYYSRFVTKYPFDFVIGSVHVVHGDRSRRPKSCLKEKLMTEVYKDDLLRRRLEDIRHFQDFDVLWDIWIMW